MGRLDGKVAVITGGNSGIGACTAELFAKEGAKVVISARRVEQLEAVAEKIKSAGGEALAVPCDISDKEQCKTVITKTVEAFGAIITKTQEIVTIYDSARRRIASFNQFLPYFVVQYSICSRIMVYYK